MPLAATTAGTTASNPVVMQSKAICEPATAAAYIPAAMSHTPTQGSAQSDSVCSSSDIVPSSSSVSATSCSNTLLWHPEDDKSVDQDDGWQVVAGKSSSKLPGQHPHYQPTGTGTPSTASSGKGQVCGRCGMRGHLSAKCKQPHCSRCNKWRHTEDECGKACNTCGSLDHRVCGASLCKSYKCRECGLYGHVYAECPNIRCNLCSEIGHKALECPSIVCNICKQKGHKAVHCTQPRYSSSHPAAASKPAGPLQQSEPGMQQLHPLTARPLHLQQHSSNSSSIVTSPTSVSSPASAVGSSVLCTATEGAAAIPDIEQLTTTQGSLTPASDSLAPSEIPLMPQLQRPTNLAEQQQLQQQHSRVLALLLKAAPDLAVACLDDNNKLQALYLIEPKYLIQMLSSVDKTSDMQHQQLEEAIASSHQELQQQQQSGQAGTSRGNQLPPITAGGAVQRRLALSGNVASSPAVASAAASSVEDVTDATQGIKPGDLAPQHAKQLVAEFGDMLPSRWQQLPSWRQLEARLSFPDGNYVQRRLQFREKRRQLQLLTLQLRSTSSGKQPMAAASNRAAGVAAITGRPAAHPRVVPEVPAAVAASTPQQQQQTPAACKQVGSTPCSYAAALAGKASAPAAASSASPCSSTSSSQQVQVPGSPFAAGGNASSAAAVGLAVCSRCGMMGHSSCSCVQPRCSRCHLWWHTEAQCNSACQFCGSLDHAGDAEQPSSCRSFKCKACRMFGHTQSICPHVQLHNQQLQRQSSSMGSSSSSSLLPPASPMSSRGPGTAGSSSNGSSETSSICPPDSPGLGQQGIKPKDLLPEHAKALQDEFPNALPSGWQQMGSWRMVEERLRVVAVEGAVFSKRRQMWRDRRKYYQALTAQALAAAARSAAAAANVAATEEIAAAAAAARLAADSGRINSSTGHQVAGGAEVAPDSVQYKGDQQMQHVSQQQAGTKPAEVGHNHQHVPEQKNDLQVQASEQRLPDGQRSNVPKQQNTGQPRVQQAAVTAAPAAGEQEQQQQLHELPDNQQCSMDPVLVPAWQQQQGSLFGLVDTAPGSMPMDSTTTGSAFSCDTNFASSPTPVSHTPSVMLSPFGDRMGFSSRSTPAATSANNSNTVTPAAPAAGFAGLQSCGSFSAAISSPMPSVACNTPVPTPRSAAAAAAASAAAAAVSTAAVYSSGGMMPMDGSRFSPMAVPHAGAVAGPMRSPLGYSAPPASPMDMHNAAAAAAAMAPGRPAGPNMYQHMVHVAQRQSQLQQQLMLQQGRYRSPAEQVLGSQQQQMLLHTQQQQQMRMQRQCRMDQAFLVQQQIRQQQQHHQQYQKLQGKALMTAGAGDEVGETGELDDTLDVLGVLGLQ